MRASTVHKAFLRYLYQREQVKGEENQELADVVSELKGLDSRFRGLYGFSSWGGVESLKLDLVLTALEDASLILYHRNNPHAELTELGRAFASRLRFPEEFELAIPDHLKCTSGE